MAIVEATVERTFDNAGGDATYENYVADLAYDLATELPDDSPLRMAVHAERAADTSAFTVLGVWLGDRPVPVGVIDGRHQASGGDDSEFTDGVWATFVRAAGPDEAQAVAVTQMRGETAADQFDDTADLAKALVYRTYPPELGTDDRSETIGVTIHDVDVLVRRRTDGTYVHLGTEEMPARHRPLIVEVDNGGENEYGSADPDAPVRRYIEHNNDNGDWCPWSGDLAPVGADDDTPCPAGCRASGCEAVDDD